ncbi:MAG: Vms1/Ankzf1 family peptidyl-tRNA hydrolase [Thermodesulfobacteriota bacterium]
MNIRSEIKKLALMEEGPYPFISLYLNTKWEDEQQRERIRLFTKNELKKGYDQLKDQGELRRHFIEDQQRIEKYVEGLVRRAYEEGVNGVAIFSCNGNKTFLTYPSIIPFENQFFLSDSPVLRPLVRISSQYQNTLAVMVETDSAKLLEVSFEGLLGEFSIESYVPGRHDQGGWSQARYQRHIKDHMDKHHKEVAEQLTELFDSNQWKHIVLIGQERVLANFKSFLPERVKLNIAETFSMDFSEGRSKVLRKVFERLLQRERSEINHEIQKLKERSPQGGLATLGLSETLEALNQGQVHTLYLLTSFSYKGGKCKGCGSLFVHLSGNPSLPCPLCKGGFKMVDLGEEMMKASLRLDGEVKWVEENQVLKEHEGVGASLRFR